MQQQNDIITENKSGWFVWTKRGRKPAFVHSDEGAATKEAERLARLHPGTKFIVMQGHKKVSVAA